jgi:predicted alpha-1,2-mannosidase
MKKISFWAILLLFSTSSCRWFQENRKPDPDLNLAQYVDPFIGTDGHGHTYPGASLPFGMVQLSPDTRLDGWDGCSGYHFSDSLVYGFSHTHLSGTGIADYCDILFMPTTGEIHFNQGTPENHLDAYSSLFKHENEKAEPGYYKTFLDDYGIVAELTATQRTGMHRYTFPECEEAHIIVDLKHRDEVLESYIKVNSAHEIEGYRRSSSWAKDQRIYFVAQFSKPFKSYELASNDSVYCNYSRLVGKNIKASFDFSTKNNEKIIVRVGISAVDVEGARLNLETENQSWNFDKVKKQARRKWNEELAKIEVETKNENDKTIFYTALYHSFLSPNIYSDVDGRYRGTDLEIHKALDFNYYTVFSLWDTYRATNPLFTLVQKESTSDFITTFLNQYKQGGILPMWELAGNYTQCMIGYHAAAVIADAYVKGIRGYDTGLALEAMMHSANHTRFGLRAYHKFGYVPMDKEHESVSKTLEYAYDDWTISQMAKGMGKKKIYRDFLVRAQSYKNVFDKYTHFMRSKVNGSWQTGFDPREVNYNFTEANSWQYSFYVPQDINGLIQLMGGDDEFIQKLDGLFSQTSSTTGRTQADITGLIGQYAHGNEPSQHIGYLYAFAGAPWKTQFTIHQITNKMYTSKPDGLCGNDDCGQMSSWYVFSAMGFYPVTPASGIYILGTPQFEKTILYAGDRPFVIRAENFNMENYYIQSATLNGEEYPYSFLLHEDIEKGGELILTMGDLPNMRYGKPRIYRPVSQIDDQLILPVPVFLSENRSFYDTLRVAIESGNSTTKIYYTLNGENPDENDSLYTHDFLITKSTNIKVIAIDAQGKSSKVAEAAYLKIPKKRDVQLFCTYNKSYSAGGEQALVDYIRGGNNYRNGLWQGYQGQDFEAVVNLEKTETLTKIGAGFLQDVGSWIWMPLRLDVLISLDGKTYDLIGSVDNNVSERDSRVLVRDFILKINPTKAHYIKLKAYNYGKIPAWHPGHGGEAFIFIDEIIAE